jgi:ParB/RepB/Spo0J family partition protein
MNAIATTETKAEAATWEIVDPIPGIFPIHLIRESATNPRKTFRKLDELAASIRSVGMLQPVLLRTVRDQALVEGQDPIVELVAGARRFRAAKMAGLDRIPGILRDLDDIQVLEIQLVENIQRDDVDEYEEAESIRELMSVRKNTADEVAERLGQSRAYVYARLKLLDLSQKIRESLAASEVPASTALLIARIPVAQLQQKAADEIIHNNGASEPMSVRAATKHLRDRYTLSLTTAPFPFTDATSFHVGACTACPKCTANMRDLYPDAPVDVCTDPECFTEKRNLHAAKLADEATLAARDRAAAAPATTPTVIDQDDDDDQESSSNESNKATATLTKTKPAAAWPTAGLGSNSKSLEPAATGLLENGREGAAQIETSIRIAAYRKAREQFSINAGMFDTTDNLLRAIAKCLVTDYELPAKELKDLYPFNALATHAAVAFVDKADLADVFKVILDVLIAPALEVTRNDVDEHGKPWPDGTSVVLWRDINAACNIDADAIRKELTPSPPAADPRSKAKKTKPAKALPRVLGKPALQGWPFPTTKQLAKVDEEKRAAAASPKTKAKTATPAKPKTEKPAAKVAVKKAAKVVAKKLSKAPTKTTANATTEKSKAETSEAKMLNPAAAWPFPTRNKEV